MIVHHPYRSLSEFRGALNLSQDDISLGWSIINDHYLTDLPLLYAPHVIAVTACFLALTLKSNAVGLQTQSSVNSASTTFNQQNEGDGLVGTSAMTTHSSKIDHFVDWLAEGQIDIKAVIDCSQEIISLYDLLEQANETSCKDQIGRYLRARGLDK